MKMEEWIHNILDSAADIKPAEPNPFLYQKIMNKIEYASRNEVTVIRLRTSLAIAASLLIIINLAGLWMLKSKPDQQQSENIAIIHLSQEMGTGTTYNY